MTSDPGRQHLPRLADHNFIQITDVVTRSSRAKRCRPKHQHTARWALDPSVGEIWERAPAASTRLRASVQPRGLRAAITGSHQVELEGLLEGGLINLAIRRGHMADEIGDCRAEGELGPVGILEPEFVVADDPRTVQNAAGDARVRT